MSHVVIVGAGPAGASLALLLSRSGTRVTLLERRRDFSREFRGEVLMPTGIAALEQMGLKTLLESVPSHTPQRIDAYLNGRLMLSAALVNDSADNVQVRAVSQPALLEMLVAEAARVAGESFTLIRGASVKELIRSEQRVTGVRLRADEGEQEIEADLVIGADGRNSIVRKHAGIKAGHVSPVMDVVWCKLPCPENWPGICAYAGRGHLLVAYHTWDDALQLGWVILKGTFGELRDRGIEEWVEEMAHYVAPDFAAHLREHRDAIEKPFLLESVSDSVEHWSIPGALVIGDAAHTMSPVGGQGLNIALRDALVAANHLIPVLLPSTPDHQAVAAALMAIEAERLPEIQHIQALQAQPPKLMLSRAWWGEPIRRLIGALLGSAAFRQRAFGRVSVFFSGVTEVHLENQ